MQYKDLEYKLKDGIATITLNRPKYRNSFSQQMLDSCTAALERSQKDPVVQIVILTGKGESFCSGGDIKTFMSYSHDPWDMKNYLQTTVHPVAMAIERLDKPLIGAINGPAYGAGMDLALMCDIRIASDRAEFCESYIRLGLLPGNGGAFLLPRLVGIAKAMEWLLTARIICAEEALHFGLINRVVPHDRIIGETVKMAKKILEFSPLAICLIKKAVHQSLSSNFLEHLDYISSQMGLLCQTDYFKMAVKAFDNQNSQHGK